ncbi:hypothetical protein [Oceanimonas marisflavi]|uniref:hypothetical protein n=1 Tax=Oceanimonas marisflavi TaxID=2059724 RepID=UPI000D327B5D|nr:hypothetical protein [Oceanimonas marisflavi]
MRLKTCFALVCSVLLSLSAWANSELPVPEHRVILTIRGHIEQTNVNDEARFDLAMLGQLPQHEFITDTPWTEGRHHFRGVLLTDLLERVGAEGKTVRLVALNDYHNDIDMALVQETPFLLVTHLDGKTMKIRDKGPLWLMLPLSDNKKYNTKRYHEMLVWQLEALEIQ